MFEYQKEKDRVNDCATFLCAAIDNAAQELREEKARQNDERASLKAEWRGLRARLQECADDRIAFENEKRDLRGTIAIQREEIASLKLEAEHWKAKSKERNRSLDEALNSGDGVYRP